MDRQPTLSGEGLVLRSLEVTDRARLFQGASDPLVWAQHPAKDRRQPGPFDVFFDAAVASRGALLIEGAAGEVLGTSRDYDDHGAHSVVIGYTFLRPSHWGGDTNARVKALMLDHAFKRPGQARCGIAHHARARPSLSPGDRQPLPPAPGAVAGKARCVSEMSIAPKRFSSGTL